MAGLTGRGLLQWFNYFIGGYMEKILGAYLYVAERLKEPSTHAALASLFMMAGINVESGWPHDVATLIAVAFGAIGFFVKESKPLTKVDG